MRFGPLAVDPPVVLAPMAGVTDAPFRAVCRRFGAGLYVGEMVTARGLVEGSARTRRMLPADDEPRPRSVQLYGVDPATMHEAVRRLIGDHGVDHVDLNFGCPVPKVTRKGGGAALPLHHVLLARIIGAAVSAASPHGVPVTVKFRIGIDDAHPTHLATGRIAVEEGVAAVALHGRTAEQHYAGAARWSAIGELVDTLRGSGVRVLGNGDIWEATDAQRMIGATGCDGVVIGRGCLGRPWLFGDLAAGFAGRDVRPRCPRLGEVVDTMVEHLRLLAAHDGEANGVRKFRKHAGWYLLGYPVGGAVRRALAAAVTVDGMVAVLGGLDRTLRLVEGRAPAPRGTTSGPRRVVLPEGWLDSRDDPTPPAGAELAYSGG